MVGVRLGRVGLVECLIWKLFIFIWGHSEELVPRLRTTTLAGIFVFLVLYNNVLCFFLRILAPTQPARLQLKGATTGVLCLNWDDYRMSEVLTLWTATSNTHNCSRVDLSLETSFRIAYGYVFQSSIETNWPDSVSSTKVFRKAIPQLHSIVDL